MSASSEVQHPVTQNWRLSKGEEHRAEFVRNYSVNGRAVINEEQPYIRMCPSPTIEVRV